jgi:hypothetical protein
MPCNGGAILGGGGSIWIHDQFLIAVHQGPNVPISLQVMLVQPELHHLPLMTMTMFIYNWVWYTIASIQN